MNLGNWKNDIEPAPGRILISEPFMHDPNFGRSVVLICGQDEAEGTIGFILNKELEMNLGDLLDVDNAKQIPVYLGGPVQQNTVHFIYRAPAPLFESSIELSDGLYWSGEFEPVVEMLEHNSLPADDFRFFLGYSGWSAGQLEGELELQSWIVSTANKREIFSPDADSLWRNALRRKGGNYFVLSNFPTSPHLN